MQINQWICRVPHLEERELQRWEGPEGIDEPLEATLSSGAEMGELIWDWYGFTMVSPSVLNHG